MGLFGSVGGLLDLVFKKGGAVPKPHGGRPPKAALKKALIPVKKLMLKYKKHLKK